MKTTLGITLAAALLCAAASADTVTYFTGKEDGGYADRTRADVQRLEQRGVDAVPEYREGSDDITLQACGAEDPAMWIAQKDALYMREVQDGCTLVDLAVHATEYAMLFFPPDSRLDSLSDLSAEHTVLVDTVGSGSELTFGVMKYIEKEHGRGDAWTETEVATQSPLRATSMASRGTIHAAFLVRTLKSDDVKRLIDQGWSLGYLWDKDINDLEWGGAPLYVGEKVTLTFDGKRKGRDWAYQVPSFVGTTSRVERDNGALFDKMLSAVN